MNRNMDQKKRVALVIGAGSVVTHDVPAGMVVAGNPARVLREARRPPGSSVGDGAVPPT